MHPPAHAPQFVIAHRAGNDVAALHAAAALGTPLIEADLHWFHGRAVVRHIKSIGPLPLYWDRWKLAHPFTRFPRLHELLDAAPAGSELMLDLKGRSPRLAAHVHDALAARPDLPRITICARSWPLLDRFAHDPRIRCVRSVGTRRGLARFFAGAHAMPAGTGISIHRKLLDPAIVARLTAATDLVMSWPVNDMHAARELHGWGVHGLISDTPATLLHGAAA